MFHTVFDRALVLSSQTSNLRIEGNTFTDVDNVFYIDDFAGPSPGDRFSFSNNVLTRVCGADGIFLLKTARDKIAQFNKNGLDRLPICMAKTHLSLSHDASLTNAPTGFTVTIRDLRAYTGAGWIVALCGDMQTMPGLPAAAAVQRIDVAPDGATVGLR